MASSRGSKFGSMLKRRVSPVFVGPTWPVRRLYARVMLAVNVLQVDVLPAQHAELRVAEPEVHGKRHGTPPAERDTLARDELEELGGVEELLCLVGSALRGADVPAGAVGANAELALLRVDHVAAHAREQGPAVRGRLPREGAARNLLVQVIADTFDVVAVEGARFERADDGQHVERESAAVVANGAHAALAVG